MNELEQDYCPNYVDAVYNLTNGKINGGSSDGPMSEIVFHEGVTPPEESAVQTELSSLIFAWEARAYVRNRQNDYPDWSIQLNKIYDDGIAKWKSEMVDPVKAKWPKDNSGPVE